jgi:uncharacterized protein (DUF433 family)
MSLIQGVIHGNTIELQEKTGLPEGQAVAVEIRPIDAEAVGTALPEPWWLDHLDVDPKVRPGKFVIKGTEVLADEMVDQIERGHADEQLLQAHPDLTVKDLAAVREYSKLAPEMRRSFGAWADEAEELDKYLSWTRQQRKVSQGRIDD